MPRRPQFIFVTCQTSAVGALKAEIARLWPRFHFAFSRPGFLTFKLPEEHDLRPDFDLGTIFARAYGFCLGPVKGENPTQLAAAAWRLWGGRSVQRVHVWERDRAEPGYRGFEPAITATALTAHALLLQECPFPTTLALDAQDLRRPARVGEIVLDCIMVEAEEWWIGYHRVRDEPSRWPGGLLPLELPAQAVSRAWLKMEEALRWANLPIPRGARVTEIGSAPGGSSQALLARGFIVTGIDPAEMHPAVLSHPRFTHLRRRSTQVRRREFRKVRWLTVDMNVAPEYTLRTVETIVTHPEVSIRGMILMLKLPDWKLAAKVPEYLERIRSWGFNIVRARQLLHNRREVCVAALQRPFRRKW